MKKTQFGRPKHLLNSKCDEMQSSATAANCSQSSFQHHGSLNGVEDSEIPARKEETHRANRGRDLPGRFPGAEEYPMSRRFLCGGRRCR